MTNDDDFKVQAWITEALSPLYERIAALEARLDAMADPLPPPPDKPHKYGGSGYDECTICGHGQYHEVHTEEVMPSPPSDWPWGQVNGERLDSPPTETPDNTAERLLLRDMKRYLVEYTDGQWSEMLIERAERLGI